MGKRSKSKRFIQQGKDSVSLHDARFPYRSTLEESQHTAAKNAAEGQVEF
ncbi:MULTISPECIES: hypothetical protein [Bacillus]|uniref:Competence protein n=1 Tax=Bacillus atrophaeus (strain 1942) TaxID=720555 RepID=A0ABM5LUV0_BACA1|nr:MULTISPECIES: hypothetical protein [Bacillus]MBT2626249.1 hypothetical protein [Bacillus sp. ISL-32]ADP31594.1 hypothetical protein BATR1942_03190 [Bacillus atrophaeus 1942]AIK48947.1 hypothetical protein DJ95_570 [Bacillus atrophaeus subsp. globigii]AKL83856.1 hypothetical protein D068_cds11250 [Bacillus atrophaeus UCMB-5137]ARW06179.1 hypothetical protein S101359_01171 [Bacillus atrophaeus]